MSNPKKPTRWPQIAMTERQWEAVLEMLDRYQEIRTAAEQRDAWIDRSWWPQKHRVAEFHLRRHIVTALDRPPTTGPAPPGDAA